MNSRMCTVIISICCLILLAGCAGKSTYVDKDYTLQTAENVQKNKLSLDNFKIPKSSMISLKDLLKVSNMNIEKVSFYDADNLLVLCTDYEYTRLDIYLFSLDFGTTQWIGTIEGVTLYQGEEFEYVAVNTTPLVIMEKVSQTYWVIKDKEVVATLDLNMQKNVSSVVGEKYIYYTDNEENSIRRFDYTTGDDQKVFQGIECYSYSIRELQNLSADGTYIYASGVNKATLQYITYVININTAQIEADVNGKFDCWESKNAVYTGYYENNEYIINKCTNKVETDVAKLCPNVAYEYCMANGDTVITLETDGRVYEFSAVDLKTMTVKYKSSINIKSYYMSTFSEECNYSYCIMNERYAYNPERNLVVFEVVSDMNRKNIFLWDVESGNASEESVKADETGAVLEGHVTQHKNYGKISDTINSIYTEYGVAIYVGENVPSAFTDYNTDIVNNTEEIQKAVTQIKKVLGYYPQGFFKDFTTDGYVLGINIYLVGNMTPLTDKYVENPTGFVTNINQYEVIALNIKDIENIEDDLCHEIAHSIYKRIEYHEIFSDTVYFDETEWAKLNPYKFEYYNSYNVDKDSKYTGAIYETEMDLNNIYFVDMYSKTMIQEDLARLMEYGMMKPDEPYLESANIKNKMKYFYNAIRRVWNTKKWPQETIWERAAK